MSNMQMQGRNGILGSDSLPWPVSRNSRCWCFQRAARDNVQRGRWPGAGRG